MNLLKTLKLAGVILGLVLSSGATSAATVSLAFPSSDSTVNHFYGTNTLGSGGGGAYFNSGDTLTETFTGTGLGVATSSTWNFTMSDYTILPAVNSFNALINGIVVDTFSFVAGSAGYGGTQVISLSNTFAAIAGDTFTLSIVATSTVFGGGGSWNWNPGGTVVLAGVAPVPLPAAFPLLLVALGGLGFAARRRKAA